MSVASVAWDFAGPSTLSQWPSDLVTQRNVSGLSGQGHCQATSSFQTSQWPIDPGKCQWPQWPRTLPGHWDFLKWPCDPKKRQWPLVVWDPAKPPTLSQHPSDPVTLRNVSGLGGPGLCQAAWTIPSDPVTLRNISDLSGSGHCWATGTFPMTQWPDDHEKCLWPKWSGSLPGHWHFPNVPVTLVTQRNVSGLSGPEHCQATALSQCPRDPLTQKNVSGLSGPVLCQATGTFPSDQVTLRNVSGTFLTSHWPSVPEKCQRPQWPGPPGKSWWPGKDPNLTKLMVFVIFKKHISFFKLKSVQNAQIFKGNVKCITFLHWKSWYLTLV